MLKELNSCETRKRYDEKVCVIFVIDNFKTILSLKALITEVCFAYCALWEGKCEMSELQDGIHIRLKGRPRLRNKVHGRWRCREKVALMSERIYMTSPRLVLGDIEVTVPVVRSIR